MWGAEKVLGKSWESIGKGLDRNWIGSGEELGTARGRIRTR